MGYRLDESGEIRGHNLACETITLCDDGCQGLVVCTFFSGTLRLAQTESLPSIVLTTLKDCDIVAVERQRNCDFGSACFAQCRFSGVFSRIDFGRPDGATWPASFGRVDGCDFTAATLDDCRFINTDVLTLRLPPWPHVVLFDPHQRAADVAAIEWPGLLGRYMQECTDASAPVSATVLHIPTLAKSTRCTPEQVRQAFGKFGGVLM